MFPKIHKLLDKNSFLYLKNNFSQRIIELVEEEIIELDGNKQNLKKSFLHYMPNKVKADPIGLALSYNLRIAENEVSNDLLKEFLSNVKNYNIFYNNIKSTITFKYNNINKILLLKAIQKEKKENSHKMTSDTIWLLTNIENELKEILNK